MGSRYNRKYQIDFNLFKKIDEEWKAYFIGWLFSDGNLEKNFKSIKITSKDKDVLDYFNQKISGGKIKLIRKAGGPFISPSNQRLYIRKEVFNFYVYCREYCIDLNKIGLIPCKSKTIEFPLFADFLPSFLRGVFEGDGHFCFGTSASNRATKEKRMGITTGSLKFAESISKYLSSYGIENVIRNSKTVFIVRVNKHDSIVKFFNLIYDGAEFKLLRKYNKFIEYFNWYNSKKMGDFSSNESCVYFNKKAAKSTGQWVFLFKQKAMSTHETEREAILAKREYFTNNNLNAPTQ